MLLSDSEQQRRVNEHKYKRLLISRNSNMEHALCCVRLCEDSLELEEKLCYGIQNNVLLKNELKRTSAAFALANTAMSHAHDASVIVTECKNAASAIAEAEDAHRKLESAVDEFHSTKGIYVEVFCDALDELLSMDAYEFHNRYRMLPGRVELSDMIESDLCSFSVNGQQEIISTGKLRDEFVERLRSSVVLCDH